MSGGIPPNAVSITAQLPLVHRIVHVGGQPFGELRDGGATFLMAAQATSILRWVTKMPSERYVARIVADALGGARKSASTVLMLDIGANAGDCPAHKHMQQPLAYLYLATLVC
jgi:hypothetical protein